MPVQAHLRYVAHIDRLCASIFSCAFLINRSLSFTTRFGPMRSGCLGPRTVEEGVGCYSQRRCCFDCGCCDTYLHKSHTAFQIAQRVPQARGTMMTTSRPLIQGHFALGGAASDEAKNAAAVNVRHLRENGRFLYEVRAAISLCTVSASLFDTTRKPGHFSLGTRSYSRSSRALSSRTGTTSGLNSTSSSTRLLSKHSPWS